MCSSKVIFFVQFRILLPLTLLISAILRYNAVSFIYLVCLLITPLLKPPVGNSLSGLTNIFFKCLLIITLLPILGHIVFSTVFFAMPDQTNYFGIVFLNCTYTEKIVRQIGYQRLNNASIWNILRLVVPDLATFIMNIVTLILSTKMRDLQLNTTVVSSETPLIEIEELKDRPYYMKAFLGYLQNAILLAVGVIVPSFLGGVYFMIFLLCLTLWGWYIPIGCHFAPLRLWLLLFTGSHILLLHFYQFQFVQDVLPPTNIAARLIGLTGIVQTDCRDVTRIIFHKNIHLSFLINPALLLFLYWILAINANIRWQWKEHLQALMKVPLKILMAEREHYLFRMNSRNEELLVNQESPIEETTDLVLELGRCSVEESQTTYNTSFIRKPWMSIAFLMMRQSYILSFMAMLAWSITYHSWMTFVFLFTACMLWILPNSHMYCLWTSPLFVTYAELLLIGQYIICMDFDFHQISTKYNMSEVGFKKFETAFPHLILQTIYSCFIVLTLRQYRYETKVTAPVVQRQTEARKSFLNKLFPWNIEEKTYDSRTMILIGNCIWMLLCKYWIFFCIIMMLFISLQDVVIYRIIYMILFLTFIIIFNLSFRAWRAINYIFWWIVVVYSILVLTLIYTYQFKDFHSYWKTITGFDESLIEDFGLEKYDTAGLFVKLLTPTSFLVFVILQLRYFHESFLAISSLDRYIHIDYDDKPESSIAYSSITKPHENTNNCHRTSHQHLQAVSMMEWLHRKALGASEKWVSFTTFLWRLSEIHIFKVMAFIVIVVSVSEVSIQTAVYVVLITILFPIIRAGRILSNLLLMWTAIIILAKMIFQLHLSESNIWITFCHNGSELNLLDNAQWVGFTKIKEKDISIAYYLRLYILVLAVIAIESIIIYHQEQHFNNKRIKIPLRGILFKQIMRTDADKGIKECMMFLANYAFYKFGLEICYIMTAIVVCVRVDGVSLFYIMMAGGLILMSRVMVARCWVFYQIVLAFFLLVQFLLNLGIPFGACVLWPKNLNLSSNQRQWLYLPGYFDPPKAYKLILDFLQFLFVSQQAYIFQIESNLKRMDLYGGGDNADILQDVECNLPIPCHDFTLVQKSGIETVKYLVFENMYWVTMAVIFITGATRINIFSFFYLMAVFIFMWYGKEFYIKPLRSLLKIWNYLIAYCTMVLFLKTALQLLGCVYFDTLDSMGHCWLVQLFGVNCLLPDNPVSPKYKSKCIVDYDNSGLAWDVICLTFLLLQRRVYSSHYFRHIVDSIQAQCNLVSKGAEIINRILLREVQKQNERERGILMKIKKQMRELKTRQAVLKKDYKEPEEHFQAIRSGDYYLLDYDENDQIKISVPTAGTSCENVTMDIHKRTSTTVNGENKIEPETHYSSSISVEHDNPELEPDSVSKIRMVLNLITIVWLGLIDGMIHFCNQFSHNYRLVAKKLSKELVLEKEKILTFKSNRRAAGAFFDKDFNELFQESLMATEFGCTDRIGSDSMLSLDQLEKQDEEEIRMQFQENTQRFNRLIVSGGLVLVSYSELLCYFLMILDQMVYASLLSLPLPLMVFLWGMLSVPRPSKTFWVTVITYTESVVVCKYFYQFGFFPWNVELYRDTPFFPPRIIGIEKVSSYAYVDIALLLALFLHRSILRKYGLWRDAADISADLEVAAIKEHKFPDTMNLTLSPENTGNRDSAASSSSDSFKLNSRVWLGLTYIVNPFAIFFRQITQSNFNATTDLYAAMFFCDFILFLVLVFGFSSFGPADTTGEESVANYLRDSKIPIPFLIMLITQFVFILIDRAIFLKKFVLGKFIFQVWLVILIHVWMFFVLPAITKTSFFNNTAAQLWYFVKSLYFALSAHQIRCGYPNRIFGNFLTKNYGLINLILYKGFLAIPFLLELRALMDWIWTDSSLAIGNWLQMEDIYANIFVIKCWREIEKMFPQERATRKRPIIKYLAGGSLLILIIFIIWFPLVFFSFFSTVFISNPPQECTFTVSIGGYQPLFTATALGDSIHPLTKIEFASLREHYAKDRNTYGILGEFEASDVTLVEFSGKSFSIWGISPLGRMALSEELSSNSKGKLVLSAKIKFLRNPDKSQLGEQKNSFDLDLRRPSKLNRFVAANLAKVINGTYNGSVDIFELFPRFLRLTNHPVAIVMDKMVTGAYGIGNSNISLRLHFSLIQTSKSWSLNETIYGSSVFKHDPSSANTSLQSVYVITFNDRKTPESLSFIAGFSIFKGGVVVMYVSFVLVVFKFVRSSFVSGRILYIYLEEAPDVDFLLQTIDDMYLAREMKDYWLEEEIFAKLLFILRCPDVLFYVTRIREIVPVTSSDSPKTSTSEHITDFMRLKMRNRHDVNEAPTYSSSSARYMTLINK